MEENSVVVELIHLLDEGKKLTDTDVSSYEQSLIESPNDLTIRARLIGFYSSHRSHDSVYDSHLHFLIESFPDETLTWLAMTRAGTLSLCSRNPAAYDELKNHWLRKCDSPQANSSTLSSAADFFMLNKDAQLAEEMLMRAQQKFPSNQHIAQKLEKLRKSMS
jgi:hypothetical protein